MVEITLAVFILAMALIPLLMLTSGTTRQTLAMEQHQVAAQFASGILDRYLAMPFKQCAQLIINSRFPVPVLESESFLGLIADSQSLETVKRTFANFTYEVSLKEPEVLEEFGEMFRINVIVSWQDRGATQPEKKISLCAVKFNENP